MEVRSLLEPTPQNSPILKGAQSMKGGQYLKDPSPIGVLFFLELNLSPRLTFVGAHSFWSAILEGAESFWSLICLEPNLSELNVGGSLLLVGANSFREHNP